MVRWGRLTETPIPSPDSPQWLYSSLGDQGESEYRGAAFGILRYSYQAVAVAPSARVTQSLKFKISAGVSSAITTVGAGAAYQRQGRAWLALATA
ncbi:YadA-like family protein [Caballeronia sp. LjRoot29]|uniref:YadA-like family protein n=1 Tax=Caballeronia sp. LjRoot29 TaxID=3342315 RepID=UPI003ED0A38F